MTSDLRTPGGDPDAAMPLAHQLRETEALHSEHVHDWQGDRPCGLYFVKTTLKDNRAGEVGLSC